MKQQMWLFRDFGWGGVGPDRAFGEEYQAPGSALTRLQVGKDSPPGAGSWGQSPKCSWKAS